MYTIFVGCPDFSISLWTTLPLWQKCPHCASAAGTQCPVHLTVAWWTAINPWWGGGGIFMSTCQQWQGTLWVWIICLPYACSNCWVQFTALLRSCVGGQVGVGSGASWHPEVSSRKWVEHIWLTPSSPLSLVFVLITPHYSHFWCFVYNLPLCAVCGSNARTLKVTQLQCLSSIITNTQAET